MQRSLQITAITIGLLWVVPAPAEVTPGAGAPTGTVPRQWRVIWKRDPCREATVSWNTRERADHSRLYLRGPGGEKRTIDERHQGRYTGGAPPLFFHHVRLTELEPASRYDIVLESDGQRSRPFYFYTAPAEDRSFQLLVGGDSRSDSATRRRVNEFMAKILAEQPTVIALAHGGDFVATGTNLAQWSQWMTDHELTTSSAGRLLPIIPVRGNHDGGPLFNQIFDGPPKDQNYFVTRIGDSLCLITLNSNISAGGTQAKWLRRQLETARPQARWLLAQYHRPAFPAVKDAGAALEHWVPLFEEHNVDLVCESDGHVIKRTVPIRNNKHDPTGVTYIGEGGLGVGQRTPKAGRWYLEEPGIAGSGHHVQVLAFHKDRLEYQTILLDGSVFDAHAFQPRSIASPSTN